MFCLVEIDAAAANASRPEAARIEPPSGVSDGSKTLVDPSADTTRQA